MNAAPEGLWAPKAGNTEADYEDAFAVGINRVAIADGATESSFARAWAEALVHGLTRPERAEAASEPPTDSTANGDWTAEGVRQSIAPLQHAWHAGIRWDSLPWFAEDKARAGAFATLLTFEFMGAAPDSEGTEGSDGDERRSEGRWRAMAIGDTCMFQIRDDALLAAFPLERAEQFNSRPLLLSSNPSNNERVWESVAFREGDYQAGDTFLFATDALAHWILAETEAGGRPWQTLRALQSQADFAAWVAGLRENHAVRNDDMTLVRLAPPDAGPEVSLIEAHSGLDSEEGA